jgi:hypothetical protein
LCRIRFFERRHEELEISKSGTQRMTLSPPLESKTGSSNQQPEPTLRSRTFGENLNVSLHARQSAAQ